MRPRYYALSPILESEIEALLKLHDAIQVKQIKFPSAARDIFDNYISDNVNKLSESQIYRHLGDLWAIGRLVYMPWHLFSEAARTLVISYNFAPYSDASAVTVAKRLRDFGVPVHVLSQELQKIRATDQQLLRLVEPYAVNIQRVQIEPTFADWSLIREYVAQAMYILEPELSSGRYLKMYSRSMFPASHVLAAHIKSSYPHIEWIAEFSDPIQHTVEGDLRKGGKLTLDAWSRKLISQCPAGLQKLLTRNLSVFAWCEYLPFSLADRLWFTNEFQREVMLREITESSVFNLLWNKSDINPHPTYPSEYYQISGYRLDDSDDKIRIGYFGEFYSNRGLDDLFQAVALLPSTIRNSIQICVYTGNTKDCDKAAAAYGLGHLVSTQKSMPLLDFFAVASQMDVLVVNDVIPGGLYGCNPYLPSKVSDYKGTGTKILALVWPGSTLSADTDVSKFILGDTLGVSNYLKSLVADSGKGKRQINV